MLNLAQLLRVPRVDALFDISSDDSKLAFAWNKNSEWQIYELTLLPSPLERRAGDEGATQLTSGPGGKFNPRYSPDGSRLAYAYDPDGGESYHLVVFDPATTTHKDLTPNITHALQPNFCWSPDGSRIAFLSDEKGHFSTYIISSNGGNAKLVLDTGHPAWQVEWSPDGKHLAVSCEMHGQDYGIFIVDLKMCHSPEGHRDDVSRSEESPTLSQRSFATPAPPQVQVTQGDNLINAHEPKWSPDGSKLAFHSDKDGWSDIGVYNLSTNEIEWITKSEGDSQAPEFMGGNIAYSQSKGAFNWIESVGPASSLTNEEIDGRKTYQIGKGIHGGISFTSDLKRMVTTFSSPSQPPDLWTIDVESGESIQLTNSLPEDLSKEGFVIPEEIHYEGMDGVEVPALLFRPQQTPAPAMVMIHGGPNWHYSAEWNPIMAHFASRGYVVLCPNYRGSTGYGREWQYAAQFDMGGVDTSDVAAGAQYLMRKGLADKVAVTGRSHGGYLTMTCLTQFPELWCAGSAVVPFTNWFKSHEDSREDLQHWNIENMGDPQENHERWYHASPYFFLDKIVAPVQMICGGNDPRCPASDSIDTRDKLVELGKSVDFHIYEEEGHSFLKIENIIDSESKRVEFLARALDSKHGGRVRRYRDHQ
ncbi:MAG TPA: alpha/beta fold hydrolase [Anaerolineales bacterium]